MWRVGVIGCGYWGPNLARNFVLHDATEVVAVADRRPERMLLIKKIFPSIKTTTEAEEILTDPQIDLVAVATPVSTHYALAKRALEEGKHVLIEKPLTTNSREAEELVKLADEKGRALFVDHTSIFTGAVSKLKEIVDAGELGDIQYFDATRINLGMYQSDVSVIWDIGPHDVAILGHLVEREPDEVSAVAMCHVGERKNLYDLAYASIRYGESMLAHLTMSWLAPVKLRTIVIGGTKKMVLYDDLENVAKIQIYDCGASAAVEAAQESAANGTGSAGSHLAELEKSLVQYRRGDMQAPKIDGKEPLRAEVDYIVKCLETGERDPINGGRRGLAVVRTLEAAERSVSAGGAFQPLGQQSNHRSNRR